MFAKKLHELGLPLIRKEVRVLQLNLGKKCNLACLHCHVDASPSRTESMSRPVIDRALTLLERAHSLTIVDITGGEPELHPEFKNIVKKCVHLRKEVVVRCNLTILLEEDQKDTPAFFAEHGIHVIASLPCYTASNVDKQRGKGTFEKSIAALQRLQELGYGVDPKLQLDLVYNPVGPYLPSAQGNLEEEYKKQLLSNYEIQFNKLYTLTNMPIARFQRDLEHSGKLKEYMDLLIENFNPATLPFLMCRDTVSVSWDGYIYDCDFNQMLDLRAGLRKASVFDIEDLRLLTNLTIQTGNHCFGCTAGAGSSCTGALV